MRTADGARFLEAGAVAAFGGLLGWGALATLDQFAELDGWMLVAGAAVGVVNGAISGLRQIYDWRCSDGFVAAVLDATWALPMTAAGLFAHAVAGVTRRAGYVAELSERRNVHVYRRGFMPRRGFAITLGNVISGAGEIERTSRRHLIVDHEYVHVWQARWLGPAYPLLYVGWSLFAALYGLARWVGGARRRGAAVGKVVETYSYYCNPIEWWAYSREGRWRPRQMVDGCGWRQAAVRPHRSVLARRETSGS